MIAQAYCKNTARAYEKDIEQFFGKCPEELTAEEIRRITIQDMVRYVAFIAPLYSKATVARKVSALRTFFDMHVEQGTIRENPARSKLVRVPKPDPFSLTNGLTKAEARRLLSLPDRSTPQGRRDHALLLLMLTTALRRSEVSELTPQDVILERGYPVIRVRGKGDRKAVVKLPEKTYMALKQYMEEQPGEKIFNLTPNGIYFIIKQYAAKLGKDISPHSLRHTSITLALDGGAPIHKVQIMARHSDPKTTMRYYRNMRELEDAATDYIDL